MSGESASPATRNDEGTGRTETAGSDRAGLRGPAPDERERPAGRRTGEGVRVDPDAEAGHDRRRTVISALVKHESGVLAEVSGLVSRRRFNIESLTVGPTTNPETARITLVIDEAEPGVRQVERQLQKLMPVVSVRELGDDAVRRELVVLKVHADRPADVRAITEMYDGRTLDAGPETVTVELTGDEGRIDDAIDAFRQFEVRELARTGQTALARGAEWTTDAEEERFDRQRSRATTEEQQTDDRTASRPPSSGHRTDPNPNLNPKNPNSNRNP